MANSVPRWLEAIESSAWAELARAVDDSDHPWRFLVLASVAEDTAAARMVVLRAVRTTEKTLLIHTDARSPKVRQLQANPHVSGVFWNPTEMVQLTVRGAASVHTVDQVADSQWSEAPATSRRAYLGPFPPGTVTGEPCVNLPESVIGRVPDESELAAGRQNFAVISFVVSQMDWLKLDRSGNLRARFSYENNTPTGSWIAP